MKVHKLAIVAGTRPEIIKLHPVMKWLDRIGVDFLLVWSGQHYDYEMSGVFFEELSIDKPHIDLEVRSGSHAEQTAKIMVGLEKVIEECRPNIVVSEGDTNTVLASALASVKKLTPFAHVEAGLRSWNFIMPEEINKRVADSIATIHFSPTKLAALNLVFEGVPVKRIHIVGNTIVDVIKEFRVRAEELGYKLLDSMGLEPEGYAVLTHHRTENVDDRERLARILRAVYELSKNIRIVFPIHSRIRGRIQNFGLENYLDNVIIAQPLGYLEFLGLLIHSSLVLTDSGGVQEEAFTLKIPTVVLRYNTERPETLAYGVNVLAGADPEEIVLKARRQLERRDEIRKLSFNNPLGDGRAGERIAKILKKYLEQGISISEPDFRDGSILINVLSHTSVGEGEPIAWFDAEGNPHIGLGGVEPRAVLIRRKRVLQELLNTYLGSTPIEFGEGV